MISLYGKYQLDLEYEDKNGVCLHIVDDDYNDITCGYLVRIGNYGLDYFMGITDEIEIDLDNVRRSLIIDGVDLI